MRIAASEHNATVGAGSTQIAPIRPGRTGLIISAPQTAAVWISFRGAASIGVGVRLPPNVTPLIISEPTMALGINEDINAISEGAAQSIGVWDFWH
jgi:hypothetical protein